MPATGSSAKPDDVMGAALAALDSQARYRVALSGGRDSCVLLHALLRHRPELMLEVVHVNHGIHPDADLWAQHCRRFCESLELALTVREVAEPPPQSNLEAWARRQRYALLADDLQPDQIVLTAHHRADQAETLLLNLLRGSGADGLAGMPAVRPLGAGRLQRPLLDVDATDIANYADDNNIHFVEDPSNASRAFDRNFLRHEILPKLSARFPQATRNIARSAQLLAAERAASPKQHSRPLSLIELRTQPVADRNRCLRDWLRAQGFVPPRYRMLDELWRQFLTSGDDAQPVVAWPGVELRRYRNHVFAMAPLGDAPVVDWSVAASGQCVWPAGGQVRWAVETDQPVRLATAAGGETLRLGGMSRRLKNLFQDAGVPPWQRAREPLLWVGCELLAVGNRWRRDGGPEFEWLWSAQESQ